MGKKEKSTVGFYTENRYNCPELNSLLSKRYVSIEKQNSILPDLFDDLVHQHKYSTILLVEFPSQYKNAWKLYKILLVREFFKHYFKNLKHFRKLNKTEHDRWTQWVTSLGKSQNPCVGLVSLLSQELFLAPSPFLRNDVQL